MRVPLGVVSELSLPRTPIPANLLLTQGISRPGQIFVMERVPHHDGPETVLELLNRPEGFFAFRPVANHDVLLISKVQTMSLSVDRQAPLDRLRLDDLAARTDGDRHHSRLRHGGHNDGD